MILHQHKVHNDHNRSYMIHLSTGFQRFPGGRIEAVIPGLSGARAVTVTLNGAKRQHTAHKINPGADGNWKISLPDVTNGDDDTLAYVIHYKLKDYDHEFKGVVNAKTRMEGPITPRYLQRRTTIVFHDDFTSGTIDLTKWTHAVTGFGGGSNQVNMLTPEPVNSYVKYNTLYIKPTLTVDHFGEDFLKNGDLDFKTTWGVCNSVDHRGCHVSSGLIPPIMSAMLMTKATIRYGRVTVKARLPKGDWLWPAIWLLPQEYRYGPWPRSGEIDIMESRGNQNYHQHWTHESLGRDYTQSTIHYGSRYDKPHRTYQAGDFRINGTTYTDGYHSFWMDWTADYIKIGVDGHTVMAMDTPSGGYWQQSGLHGDNIWAQGGKDAPFDQPFFLIVNLSVGGGWFFPSADNEPYPQPWNRSATKAQQFAQFWNARHLWEPTWQGENTALRIGSVTLEQY